MLFADRGMGDLIESSILISLILSVSLATFQTSFSQTSTPSPFLKSNSEIQTISAYTSDGKYFVNMKYSPTLVAKGETVFFMVNLFENDGGKQIRIRHVDCDLIIDKDGTEMYRMSSKYGEPFFHSINGVMLPNYKFTEHGKYIISVEIAGILFVPIEPVFANFSALAVPTTEGKIELKLSAVDQGFQN